MIDRAIRCCAAALLLAPVVVFSVTAPRADDQRGQIEVVVREYLHEHPEDVQRIVKDYLVTHPEVLKDALAEFIRQRRATADAAAFDKAGAIRSNAALLFGSPRQVTLGNPNGGVTLVEFFDYNCGYCKRALADTLALLQDDPDLKIVLKEYPILGPGSAEAARVAVALHMQDAEGRKYLAFHRRLLSERGPIGKEAALAAADEAGADVERLIADLASAEVGETIAENVRLAQALGINGTPTYIVADAVVTGAVGTAALKNRLHAVRK